MDTDLIGFKGKCRRVDLQSASSTQPLLFFTDAGAALQKAGVRARQRPPPVKAGSLNAG